MEHPPEGSFVPSPIANGLIVADFRQNPRIRNYLSRGEQWRLLGLVMALGLVALLMNEARKPDNWRWFVQLAGEDGQAPGAPGSAAETPPDTRLIPPPPEEEIPGALHLPVPPEAEQIEEDTTGRYFPGVKPKYFDAVRDDTFFRRDDRNAWFHLLEILNTTDEKTLEAESTGPATFAQLFSQSNDYRGRLVTLRGRIRRAHPLSAPKNDCGIEQYYQTWFQPEDNPTTPMVVYCLHLPEGFPTGMYLSAEVTVTGFFFKRWAYKAKDSLRTAPVVLARTVDWHGSTSRLNETVDVNARFFLIVLGAAAALSVVTLVYLLARFSSTRPREPREPPDLNSLAGPP